MLKKIFLPVIFALTLSFGLLVHTQPAFAEDCMMDPVYDVNWNAEVIIGVRLRNIPCMTTSVVITTLPVGEVIKVIAETDGYYKIRRANGQEGWVGQTLVAPTTKTFTPDQPPAPKERLYDVVGHKYETAIRWMDVNGIISGYPDLSFKPDGTLNRAEMVKIMSLTYNKANPANIFESVRGQYNTACFNDITMNKWYTEYVCYAKAMGILQGYPDGSFRPEQPISRVEALKIVLNSMDITVETLGTEPPKNYFTDTDPNEWYAPYIATAYFNNLIEEKSGNYYPAKSILRGEASNLIYLTFLLRSQP